MTDEEIQAKIDAAVAEATKALNAKNTELLNEKKEAKRKADEAEAERQRLADEAAANSTNIDDVKAALEAKHKRELEKLSKQLEEATGLNRAHLIDGAITKALVDNNVPAHFHEPLTAMFRSGADVKDGKALRGDMELTDALKDFFAGDLGKHYVSAPANSGTGATGSTATTSGASNLKRPDGKLNHTAVAELIKSDRAAAKSALEAIGTDEAISVAKGL